MMNFDLADKAALNRVTLVSAAILVFVGVLMRLTLGVYPDRPAPADFSGPISAVQFAGSASELDFALGNKTPYRDRVHTAVAFNSEMDLLFILCYAAFMLSCTALVVAHFKERKKRNYFPCVFIVIAALADFAEDFGIFHALSNDGTSGQFILVSALVKWLCFYVATISMAALLFRTVNDPPFGQPLTGILTVLLFLSGVVGLTGLAAPIHFQHGAVLFSSAPLVAILSVFAKRLQ